MHNASDLLTRLRNGYNAHKSTIRVKPSKQAIKLLNILKDYGLIRGISYVDNRDLLVSLRYNADVNALLSIGRLSKPSVPLHFSSRDLWKFHKSYGVVIVNTSAGLICHHSAIKIKLGGQLVCYIL